jgi:hypothetical protein
VQDLFVSIAAIKTFVRDTLKCGCPDNVFNDVRIGLPSLYNTHSVKGGLEILIGGRLLVAVVPYKSVRNPDTDIPLMLKKGRNVRDDKGFNRFRLVLVGVTDTAKRKELQGMTTMLEERLHIHLLDKVHYRTRRNGINIKKRKDN